MLDTKPNMAYVLHAEPLMTDMVTTTEAISPDTSYIGSLRRGLTPQGLDALPAHDRQRLLDDLAALGTTPEALLREPGGVLGPRLTATVDLAWIDGTHTTLHTDLPPSAEELVHWAHLRPDDTARSYMAMNHILAHTFGPGLLPARLASPVAGSFAQRLVNIYARVLRGEVVSAAYRAKTGREWQGRPRRMLRPIDAPISARTNVV